MRALVAVGVLAVVAMIAGCPKTDGPEPGPALAEEQKPEPQPEEPSAPEGEQGEDVSIEEQDLPDCPASEFGDPDSDVAFQAYADLDLDGKDECVIGFQARTTDDLGEPVAPAYLELVKWNGSEWEGWFGVPAPDGETYVDEDSLVISEDINEDGFVEFGVQFYHFGVSSRRENLYLWQVRDGGLEPAVGGGVIESTSDDGMQVEETDLSFPGPELIVSRAAMGDEAHAEPHRYEVTVYGWSSGMYRPIDSRQTSSTFADPFAAIEAMME